MDEKDGREETESRDGQEDTEQDKAGADEGGRVETPSEISAIGGWGAGGSTVPATTDGVPYLFHSRTLDVQLQHQMNQAQAYAHQSHFAHPRAADQHQHTPFQPMAVDNAQSMAPPSNVNPSMNSVSSAPGVLLMNVPDHNMYPQGVDVNVLNGLVNADQVLEGLPGSMFDWGKNALSYDLVKLTR